MEATGVSQKLDQFLYIFLGLIYSGHISKSSGYLVFAKQARLAFTKTHGAAAATAAALHLAHEKHEHRDNYQDGKGRDQQLGPHALLFGLFTLHNHVVFQQIIDQPRVLNHRTDGLKETAVESFTGDGQAIDGHFLHLISLNFLNKLRITQLLRGALHVEIIKHRQQDGGYHQPQQ